MSECPKCGAVGEMTHVETFSFKSATEEIFQCAVCRYRRTKITHRADA